MTTGFRKGKANSRHTGIWIQLLNKYSDDETSKFTAGMIQGRDGTFLTMDQLDKDIVGMMKDLKVGEYSQPVEFTMTVGKEVCE